MTTATETVTITRSQLELLLPALSGSWNHWHQLANESGLSDDRKRIRLEIAEDMWKLYEELSELRNQ
jgi:hypothetical protein